MPNSKRTIQADIIGERKSQSRLSRKPTHRSCHKKKWGHCGGRTDSPSSPFCYQNPACAASTTHKFSVGAKPIKQFCFAVSRVTTPRICGGTHHLWQFRIQPAALRRIVGFPLLERRSETWLRITHQPPFRPRKDSSIIWQNLKAFNRKMWWMERGNIPTTRT